MEEHLLGGGKACFVEDDYICYADKGEQTRVASIPDIPLTLNGLAEYNVMNCLSATAAAFSLGLSLHAIRKGLLSFVSDPDSNPGRGNYFEAGGVSILLDFAHNVHGLQAILKTTEKLKPDRRILTMSRQASP